MIAEEAVRRHNGKLRSLVRWPLMMGAALALLGCVTTGNPQPVSAGQGVDAGHWVELLAEARAQARRCGRETYDAAEPLEWNEQLGEAAAVHSRDMARSRRLSHVGSRGETLTDRIRATGYRPRAWGENVAAGQPDAGSVVASWLDSPGHCANIMNPDYSQFGAAVARGSDGVRYWTLVLAAPLD